MESKGTIELVCPGPPPKEPFWVRLATPRTVLLAALLFLGAWMMVVLYLTSPDYEIGVILMLFVSGIANLAGFAFFLVCIASLIMTPSLLLGDRFEMMRREEEVRILAAREREASIEKIKDLEENGDHADRADRAPGPFAAALMETSVFRFFERRPVAFFLVSFVVTLAFFGFLLFGLVGVRTPR